MSKNIAKKIINFNSELKYTGELPDGFRVLNPYRENPETMVVMKKFYHKYYNDSKQRRFIIGINPSRHGAGVTGIPFTDTKRLDSVCGIKMESAYTHEISSVFMYDMIAEYGGAKKFYQDFYINSPFPLAITRANKDKKWVNANYYEDPNLILMTENFMVKSLQQYIEWGIDTTEAYVLGIKNAKYINILNKKYNLFGTLVALEHPRYIQQYKSKEKQLYIDKYLTAFYK